MEPFVTYCSIDTYGRLNILSSTQIVFHCRRIIANALHMPKSMVRVVKASIGGGFVAKQSCVSEMYPAFVTWKTKKPSKMIFSRYECHIASSPRHEMEVRVRLGATKEGKIRAIDLYTLPIPVLTASTVPRLSAFPVTSLFLCTVPRPSASALT